MKTRFFVGRLSVITLFSVLLLNACTKDDEGLSGNDVTNVTSESLTDSYFEDVDDMTLVAVDDKAPLGRIAEDNRFSCAEVMLGDGSTKSSGEITIDFGEGCVDLRGNERKGKIHISYSGGPRGSIGFTTVTTFEGYSVNDIELEGTRTVERVEAATGIVKHEIELAGGKATWPDATFATRMASFTREWNEQAGTVTLDGEASGSNRNGRSYTMNITTPLVYKTECAVGAGVYMAVAGVKVFSAGDRQLTIDFGDGECDKKVTATVGAITRTISVGEN